MRHMWYHIQKETHDIQKKSHTPVLLEDRNTIWHRQTWHDIQTATHMTHRQIQNHIRHVWHTDRETHDKQTETRMTYIETYDIQTEKHMTSRQRHTWHTDRDTYDIQTETTYRQRNTCHPDRDTHGILYRYTLFSTATNVHFTIRQVLRIIHTSLAIENSFMRSLVRGTNGPMCLC